MKKSIILLYDNEDHAEASFDDPFEAAVYAENNNLFAKSYVLQNGPLTDGEPCFFKAKLVLATNEIETEKTALYKFGSATTVCRDGWTFGGRVVAQNKDYIVAWGASAEEAENRVKKQAKEGRKRAARDQTWQRILDEVKVKPIPFRDPHGFWIDVIPGLREKLNRDSQAAYDNTQ